MRSTAYLLPRGASPERPIVIAGSSDSSHRTVAIFRNRGHYAITAGSSDSSHRTAVIAGNHGDAWSLPVRPILIERTASRSRSSSRSSSIGLRTLLETRVDAIARSWPSAHLKRHRTAQTRRGRTHDRGPIEPRSSRDRSSLLGESSPIDRQAIDEGSRP